MTTTENLIAIYDFEFFPYALGDVLTWNVRTAMRCNELGKPCVDLYICADENFPASIYQRGLINFDNFELFFSELYSAFGTNPKLGNIFIFRSRESMLEKLQEIAAKDEANLEVLTDYLNLLEHRIDKHSFGKMISKLYTKLRTNNFMYKVLKRFVPKTIKQKVSTNLPEAKLNNYFIKYVYSHERINDYYEKYKSIPYLKSSLGCVPDVDELIAKNFKGKKIVPFHLRLRRLDVGYGGDHTYIRDSNFLEWYDFLREASFKYPDVQFVALGRLQEKPLEILRLPNVTNLRIFGMGLGHELTLMLKSDLFIGTSSGFAAFANFSELPYFITKMNKGSCDAYAIAEGATHLPFAKPNQKLIYADETAELLMSLLVEGLQLIENNNDLKQVKKDAIKPIDINAWLQSHENPSNPARTTSRFYTDNEYRNAETAYLLMPFFEKAQKAYAENNLDQVNVLIKKLKTNFPDICKQFFPEATQ